MSSIQSSSSQQNNRFLTKKELDARTLGIVNRETNASGKLSHANKLLFINDNYCEIARQDASFRWYNILACMLLFPVLVLSAGAILFFIYDALLSSHEYSQYSDSHSDIDFVLFLAFILLVIALIFFCFSV